MKKLLVFLVMVIALMSSAFAVSVADDSLDIDDAVQRSNPRIESDKEELDDSTELEYVTFTFTVTANNGDINVTDVVPDLTGFSYFPLTDENDDNDKYSVTTSLPVEITNGNNKKVTIKVLVPSNLNTIDASFARVEHAVSVDFTANNTNGTQTDSADGKFYVENGLELSNIELESKDETIECDVEDELTEDLECDDEIEELSSSDDFQLKFNIENIFDGDSRLDLEEVEIELDTNNNDVDPDDDNFDEDLDTEDELTFTVDFEVDSDVDDGDDVEITITAIVVDENDARHGFQHTFTGEFQVPKYDVQINSVQISPGQICQGESSTITWDIENYGSKDQDNVRLQIVNANLRLDEVSGRIVLEDESERDNDNQGSFIIQTQQSTKASTYAISFRMFYEDKNDDDAVKIQTLNLRVNDCDGDDEQTTPSDDDEDDTRDDDEEEEEETPTIIVNPAPTQPTTQQPTIDVTSPTTAGPVQAIVTKKSNNVWFIIGGIIVLLVLIALIVLVLSLLLR